MSLESGPGFNEEEEKRIVNVFRKADQRYLRDSTSLTPQISGYMDTVGELNFAVLERVFRKNRFNAHFLAVPAMMIEAENPQILVVDINDMYLRGVTTPKPYAAIAYPSLEDVTLAARKHGLVYDVQRNLRQLAFAGGYAPNPEYKGDLSPQLVFIKPKDTTIGPFSAN